MVKTVGSKIYSLLGPETSVSNQGPGSSQRSASCPSKKAEPIGEEGTSFGTAFCGHSPALRRAATEQNFPELDFLLGSYPCILIRQMDPPVSVLRCFPSLCYVPHPPGGMPGDV